MKLFSSVTRYICFNCKKDFKTVTRHECKRDPDKKNCYTCKHNIGWDQKDVEDDYGGMGYHTFPVWFVDCDKGYDDKSAPDLALDKYVLNCPEWELKEEK